MVMSAFIAANTNYVMLILFALVMTFILYFKRKNLELQKILFPFLYLIMYKTKWGLKKMDSIAKRLEKHKNALSITSITLGFIGMIIMTVLFLFSVYKYFFVEQAAVVAPLLPGATIPGMPPLSFVHWIIAIFVLATVHEFSHGVFARMHKIKVKSSGFAFFGIILPIIPAAFVEPDEDQMHKKSKKAQLAVLSAGTFSNFIFAGIFFLILSLIFAPLSGAMMEQQGVIVAGISEDSPAFVAGIETNEIITSFNGIEINSLEQLFNELNKTEPFEKVTLQTENNTYNLVLAEHPDGKEYGYIGINLADKTGIKQSILDGVGKIPVQIFAWFSILIYWLFLTNLMVGLVNLLPLGIVDGGQMFFIALSSVVKNEKTAKTIFATISIFLLLLFLFFLIPAMWGYFITPFQ
jgi:membrane-associated protease RseP (regulator of RpoE activity)